MSELDELTRLVTEFRDEREWEQFHTPKNLAVSLSIESAELLELFQWNDEIDDKDKLVEEMADIFIYLLLLAERTDVNLYKSVKEKIKKNEKKYPSEEYKGKY